MKVQGFETESLVVRPLQLGDHAECCLTRLESTIPPNESDGEVLTLSQLEPCNFGLLITRRDQWALTDHRYVISAFLRLDGRFVGDTMLFDVHRQPFPRAEIGTVLASAFQGKGLGPELIAGTVRWGFKELGLQQIHGFIEHDNRRSTVACLRAGFSLLTSGPVGRNFQGEERWGWPILARAKQ